MKQPNRCATAAVGAAVFWGVLAAPAGAASRDLGHGFTDHGVAVPISNHRGTVATADGAGHDVALMWLMDHRGGYELLLVDVTAKKSQEFPIPFTAATGDSPYASILSSANRFYTHFDSNFVEFDPGQKKYTFHHATTPQMAMSMTEDDAGVIWSVTYPNSGLVSFDPKTQAFRDYGVLYKQNWRQYPRYIAADDAGWIYFGVGNTASQIVAVDPASGKATPVLAEGQRRKGIAYVYRDRDGKVYGQALQSREEPWWRFYKGAATQIGADHKSDPKPYVTGSQALFHKTFPDGKVLEACDLVDRKLTVADPKAKTTQVIPIDYASEGALVMGVAAAADGTLTGGSAFPMRAFSLDPKTGAIISRADFGQWNAVAPFKDRYYVGGYPGGWLLEWRPNEPWVATVKAKDGCNPQWLAAAPPHVYRPTKVVPLSDDRTVILAGGPDYGYTGGGLMFYDRETKKSVVLTDKDVVPDQSTRSLVELPDHRLLGGTTTEPGTGGEKKAGEAVVYLMDPASKKVEWRAALIPGTQDYTDAYVAPSGRVYGVTDRRTFFVFDPAKREVVGRQSLTTDLGPTVAAQGPRVFVPGEPGETFVIGEHALGRIDPATDRVTVLAKCPVPLEAGGAYRDGNLYVVSGSHLVSYKVR